MKLLAIAACAATLSLGSAIAGGEGWTHDFEAAKKQAASENKDLLIDFTGSDWCGWCIRLREEVFSHDEFKEGVKDTYVLVELDFPQDRSKNSEETWKQNEALKEKYAIRGFPTIMLADAEGRPYAQTGYQEGGAGKYLAHLAELQKAKEARDKALAEAADLEGVDKAKALVSAVGAMKLSDPLVSNFYGDVVSGIREADPDDQTGYIKQVESNTRFAAFENQLNSFGQQRDHAGALKLVEDTLAKDEFEGEKKQQITLIKAMIFAEQKKLDQALKTLDEAEAIDPDSEIAARIPTFREQVGKMKAESDTKGADE